MPIKNPALLDKVVLKSGGSIVTDSGAEIVTVDENGNPDIVAPVQPGDLLLANGKIYKGGTLGIAEEKTLSTPASSSVPAFTGAPLGTHSHDFVVSSAEAITVTAGTGVSSAVASIPVGMVESVYVTAGGVTGAVTVIPAGQTPATKECTYNATTGVFQFLIADAVTAAVVTYATRAVSAVSAGTPGGTVSAPTITVTPTYS